MKKLLSLLLVLAMLLSFAACGSNGDTKDSGDDSNKPGTPGTVDPNNIEEKEFTYKTYSSSFGNNWNPHTWETSGDSDILSYIETPFVGMQILDSENALYQWTYEAATAVTDVTASHKEDLEKFAVNLPAGKTAADIDSGYVFEIKLRDTMKWEDGTPINADTYIYSMKQLLSSDMRNYRANLYYAGESAVAGGNAFYNSGAPIYSDIAVYTYDDDGNPIDVTYESLDGKELYISMSVPCAFLGESVETIYYDYGYGRAGYFALEDGTDFLEKYAEQANAYDMIPVTDANRAEVEADLRYLSLVFEDDNDAAWTEWLFYANGTGEVFEYDDTVGCYKVDDYTIIYVCESQIDFNYFLTSLTSNWIVYESLYEGGKDTTGELVTTDYATSKDKTMSYGPYKIKSFEADKQIVYVQNENWYGYDKTASGYLYSITPFEVDGKQIQRYKTTTVVVDKMEDSAAKEAFLKGQLTDWSVPAEDVVNYTSSEQLYKVDETYTQSFFFNTGVTALQEMDNSKGNTNSVVLSNENFRKAFSLSIDRADWVLSTAGYKPAYALMNNLYYYNIYEDPSSSYRGSNEAMQAVCNLYGVQYGEGQPYATLKDAYESVTGYNLTEAKELMKKACGELVAAGLYKEGEAIHIRIGYKKGSLDSSDQAAVAKMNEYINAAVEGSGFGKVTLEAIDNINDRYGDTAKGEYAIGYGAWGGAAFYPFRNMQVYCDTEQYSIHEAGCWDPSTEQLTLKVKGEDVTMSWQDWSRALIGTGPYANEDFEVKLSVTAQMEQLYLEKYYRIPLAGTTVCSMLSYQVSYYTEDYNIMYGFGGLELLQYNYDDAAWNEYVSSQGGTLSYE